MSKKIAIAHRGYSEIAPENTKLAFEAAFLFGFPGVEIDVHMTKDKKLVVIHDESIDRTCDGKGKVEELTLAEIRQYNFGHAFNPNMPKQTILTYKEFLELCGPKFDYLNVEIKTNIIHYEGIEKAIYKVQQEVKPKAKIIYSSFYYKSLEIMHEIDSNLSLAFLFVKADEVKDKENIREVCEYLHPFFKSVLNKKDYEIYKKINLPLNIWSIAIKDNNDQWADGSYAVLKDLESLDLVNILISNSVV